MRPYADTEWVIAQAKSIGFDLCGVAPISELTGPEHRDEWLARGYSGTMQYLHDARRADPQRTFPEAKSVIVCAINYNTAQPRSTEAAAASGTKAWISRYAWGDDYHSVIGEKLERLAAVIKETFGDDLFVRAYVDTGPVSERVAARQAGLGWLAKNTCLINEDIGSWLFLGVVLTSLELAPSQASATTSAAAAPPPDLCGHCTLCIDACPTAALVEPYVLDASRCISYLTIELRDSIPEEFRAPMGRHVFGCDICQDVCPWNRRAPTSANPAFAPRENLLAPEIDWLLSLSEDDFRCIFKGSAVRRTKWRGLIRNACIAAGNARDAHALLQTRLSALAASADPIIAEHAQWALAQLGDVDDTEITPETEVN
jgi:epoxyqueuosine reductase